MLKMRAKGGMPVAFADFEVPNNARNLDIDYCIIIDGKCDHMMITVHDDPNWG